MLFFELPEALRVTKLSPAVLLRPGGKGLLAGAVAAAQLGGLRASLLLLKDADDLFFSKSAPTHAFSSTSLLEGLK